MNLRWMLPRASRVAAALWRLHRGRPAVASINLLNRCNQSCPMCRVPSTSDAALGLGDLARALRGLRAGGVRIVELSGGEPFLRRDLPEIIELVDGMGLLFTFNTNGTAISADGLKALAGARGLLQVAVSLDSLDREKYAYLRGRDLLPRALDGLEQLRGARLKAPLKLNLALSGRNASEAPAILDFARRRGLFLSAFPVNQGPGAHRSECAGLRWEAAEREAAAAVFDDFARRRRRGEPLWEPSAFYRTAARFLRGEPLPACGAGRLFVDVRADGSVAPCVDLPAVSGLDGLESGEVWQALERAQPAVQNCRQATPCCYTCTVSLAETGRHPFTYAMESAQVLAASRLSARLRAGGRAA